MTQRKANTVDNQSGAAYISNSISLSHEQPVNRRPRAVLYTRVSTQKQEDRTRGNYTSLEIQKETLEIFCEKENYEVVAIESDIKSSRTLKRSGIEKIRSLVREGKVDIVCAMRYDRIGGADDFAVFRKELSNHDVKLRVLDELADSDTAKGRLIGRISIAFKDFDVEELGEKVREYQQVRIKKEEYVNGKPPFGFLKNPTTKFLNHDPAKVNIVNRMFEIYSEKRSDFAVRDWLKANKIPSPNGKEEWVVGTIRDVLKNVRYIGKIELNGRNKNRLPALVNPEYQYEIIDAKSYGPMISKDLWDLVQSIRYEQAQKSPRPATPRARPIADMGSEEILSNELRGPTHNVSRTKSNHFFLLQGLIFCPVCGHPMSPDYTEKIPNEKEKRKKHSFTNYYACSLLRKHPDVSKKLASDGAKCGRVLASRVEKWAIGRISSHARDIHMIQAVKESVPLFRKERLEPDQKALEEVMQRIRENKKQREKVVNTLLNGNLNDAAIEFINVKANELEYEHTILIAEEIRLREALEIGRCTSYEETVDRVLDNFSKYAKYAKPEELQQILRLFIRQVTCDSSQVFHAEFYQLHLPEQQYFGLLTRNEKGELEWQAAGSRVPWEFYRFQNRLQKQGANTSE